MAERKTPIRIAVGSPRRHARVDREMEFLFDKYVELHPDHGGPIDPDVVSRWAIGTGIYQPPIPPTPIELLKRRLSRHLCHRYFVDPQNREVRALHALPYEERTPQGTKYGFRYYPLFTTDPQTIKRSFQLRRTWAFKRVQQIETDRLSYNDNNQFGAFIEQISFDFDTELNERNMPTVYPTSAPDGIDDEDDEPR